MGKRCRLFPKANTQDLIVRHASRLTGHDDSPLSKVKQRALKKSPTFCVNETKPFGSVLKRASKKVTSLSKPPKPALSFALAGVEALPCKVLEEKPETVKAHLNGICQIDGSIHSQF